MRRTVPLALLAALLAAALAGCGSSPRPRLDRADAAGLIALAGRVAAEGACAQARDIPKLHARAVSLVNAHRVPAALQEPLLSAVNALSAEQPVCLPTVPASATSPAVTAGPTPRGRPQRHGPPHHHDHGPPHGHGPGHHR